jgi:hypothetical protein
VQQIIVAIRWRAYRNRLPLWVIAMPSTAGAIRSARSEAIGDALDVDAGQAEKGVLAVEALLDAAGNTEREHRFPRGTGLPRKGPPGDQVGVEHLKNPNRTGQRLRLLHRLPAAVGDQQRAGRMVNSSPIWRSRVPISGRANDHEGIR